jgi:hypothetical protein
VVIGVRALWRIGADANHSGSGTTGTPECQQRLDWKEWTNMSKLGSVIGLMLVVGFSAAAPARADVVSDWNAVTMTYVNVGNAAAVPAIPVGRAGPPGLFDIALVQAAIHDAVQAIEGRFEPYYYSDPTRRGVGSSTAAVAAAAHRVLVLLYPGRQGSLDAFYDHYLKSNGLVGDPGLEVGEAAAVALHTAHYRPLIPLPDYFGDTNIGQWRSAVPMAFLFMAISEPFTLNRVSQFRPPPPPPLNSVQYFREYQEVKAIGKASVHPNEDTDVARFWSGNFAAQFNGVMRQVASAQDLSVGDSARMFALANIAAADTAMAVWESKYFYNFWRPVSAIQEGDADGIERTEGDALWTPLLGTPPYPDYVSGANGLTGAFTEMLALVFGTDAIEFSVTNSNPLLIETERFYTSLSEAAEEVVDARIQLGIHFRSADVEARRLGNRVAHWTFQKILKPIPGGH